MTILENNRISIIIPLYNNKKYIVNCIESIFSQNYEDIEVIIIDDGSTDGSYELVKSKYLSNERVNIIKQTNKGPSAARNRGLLHATGKWIVFLDSDDELEREALNIAVSNIKECDLVVGGWTGIYSNIKEYYGPNIKKVIKGKEIKALSNYLLSNGLMYKDKDMRIPSIEGPVAKLYLSRIIKDNNLKFPENISYAEDVAFNYFYLKFCNRVSIINKSLYNASRHEDSLSNQEHNFMETYEKFEKIIKNFDGNKFQQDEALIYRKFIWLITDLEKKQLNIKDLKIYINKYNITMFSKIDKSNLSNLKRIELKALMNNYITLYFVLKIGIYLKNIKNKLKY